jgi:hypothetical protein
MKLLKLQLYKVTVVHILQACDSARRINFCNWLLQSVHDGEVDPHDSPPHHLAVSQAVPARGWEVTVGFTFLNG